jgi:hypothetical protein
MATEAPLPSHLTLEYENDANVFKMPEDPNPGTSVVVQIPDASLTCL